MEQLQQALERFKQQANGASAAKSTVLTKVPPPIMYSTTRVVECSEDLLRRQRIIAAFDQGPFVEGYKLLRTQVLHRLRENGWNVLGVTSPNERRR
jgi:hypothetical protein